MRILFFLFFLISCSEKESAYKIQSQFQLKSSFGKVVRLFHKKSGAQILLIKNKDLARSFGIAFRTPPYDNTGLFHVFEHAVLAGSKLYPSKSNFSHVSDSTLASFINAMTYPVFTFYPFITRHSKDFENVLSVYMDAVFFPKVLTEPKLVKREGWRYEIHPQTKQLSFNGVVFSEMKGVFSQVYSWLWHHFFKTFLPDTAYAYESGGFPDQIIQLQFAQIVEAHKKYYHPQNALILLYGNLNFKKHLKTIDENFLSHFERQKNFKIPHGTQQSTFKDKPSLVEAFYPSLKSKERNQDFILKGWLLKTLSPEERVALPILVQAFFTNSIAPLKLRILKEQLARSVDSLSYGKNKMALAVLFEGTQATHLKKIDQVLKEEIDKVVVEGLDSQLLLSILNQHEFYRREKIYNARHKAYNLFYEMIEHWIYPLQTLEEHLDIFTNFKKVRNLLKDQNFIKEFVRQQFKDNKEVRWLIVKPDFDHSKKFHDVLEKKLLKALTEKPLIDYKKEDELYQKWVSAKEPKEILEKTPLLELSDLQTEIEPIPFEISHENSYEIIEYPQETQGISYVELFFDLKGVPEKDLKNLMLFMSLLKKTNTKNYSFKELSKQIGTFIGDLSFDIKTYQSAKSPEQFKAFMKVRLNFLNSNLEKNFELLKEVLIHNQLSPQDHVQNLLEEIKLNYRNQMLSHVNSFLIHSNIKAFFPVFGSFRSEVQGATFAEYLLKFEMNFVSLREVFHSLLKNIFNRDRFELVSLTSHKKQFKNLKKELVKLFFSLPHKGLKDQNWNFSKQKNYMAYAIPGEVQFLSETRSFKDYGLKYSGALEVYSQYLNTYFLHPKIREQGGAYGVWNTFYRNGLWNLFTYRDPHLQTSFEIFSQAVDFMKKEQLSFEKLKPSILGSLKPFYKDQSVSAKADFMTSLYLRGWTWSDHIKIKKEILETTPEDFKTINSALAKAVQSSKKSVAGKASKIEAEASFAKEILFLP